MKTWQVLVQAGQDQAVALPNGEAANSPLKGLASSAPEFSPSGGHPPSTERRRAVRYRVSEQATVALCNPPEFTPIPAEIINASTRGLQVRMPRNLHRGQQVYILVENAAVFGTIRYSVENAGKTFDTGVEIDQIVMRPGMDPAMEPAADPAIEPAAHPAIDQPVQVSVGVEKRDSTHHPFEILCVEDNPGDVRIMEMILEEIRIPHRLSVARDGAQALQRLLDSKAPRPDLVLLDLNLPKVNGFEFLERVRRDSALKILPVVILSSSTARSDRERAAALGVKAYLQKPDDLDRQTELRRKMELLMSELAEVGS